MQEETKIWLTYSEENLEAAKVLLESELPFFYPDEDICKNSISLAERVIKEVKGLIR